MRFFLNPKLFQGHHKEDTLPRKSVTDHDSLDDSTSGPPLVPPSGAPSSSAPLDMNTGTITHPREELHLLQEHASLLEHLLCSNCDHQAFISTKLATIQPATPVRVYGGSSFPPPL